MLEQFVEDFLFIYFLCFGGQYVIGSSWHWDTFCRLLKFVIFVKLNEVDCNSFEYLDRRSVVWLEKKLDWSQNTVEYTTWDKFTTTHRLVRTDAIKYVSLSLSFS